MQTRKAIQLFIAFAFAYFISTLIRAITATLSPTLVTELHLQSRDLGLLAGAYFLGFATTQIPLGAWLDRHGPRRVEVTFLTVAVLGCLLFSASDSFWGLWIARALCGIGVSACLMAALTGYRRWYAPDSQLRANSWMLMVGALGMIASTLPVQWLLPLIGWRAIFQVLAIMLVLSVLLLLALAPPWENDTQPINSAEVTKPSYGEVWKSPVFQRMAPIGFFCYGGMVAMQTLWAAPWMTKVAGYSSLQAANGLFWINVAMLFAFLLWGWANPWLERRGFTAERLMKFGIPISFLPLALISIAGSAITTGSAALWTLYCVSSTVCAMAQPAVALAFRKEMAGRALSAFNLVIFVGVFSVQWGLGLLIDMFRSSGQSEVDAMGSAMGLFGMCCLGAYLNFLVPKKP
jgi:MFS family permease